MSLNQYTKKDIATIRSRDYRKILDEVMNTNYSVVEPREGTLTLGSLLLRPPTHAIRENIQFTSRTSTQYEEWVKALEMRGLHAKARRAGEWLLWYGSPQRSQIPLYIGFLFNIQYGRTQTLLEKILLYESSLPRFLDVLILHIFHQGLGLSYTDIQHLCNGDFSKIAEKLKMLFAEGDSTIESWLTKKKVPLYLYGGSVTPTTGMLDTIVESGETGIESLNLNAQAHYDLGGGFSTSEFERVLGTRFVSADILSSDMNVHDSDLLIQQYSKNTGHRDIANTFVHDAYVERQSHVQYMHFDAMTDSFPDTVDSYLIVSSGYILGRGTIPAFRHEGLNYDERQICRSLLGIQCIMQLIHARKDVDIFVTAAGTRHLYLLETCLIQARNGTIVNLVTTENTSKSFWNKDTLTLVYLAIAPNNVNFLVYH